MRRVAYNAWCVSLFTLGIVGTVLWLAGFAGAAVFLVASLFRAGWSAYALNCAIASGAGFVVRGLSIFTMRRMTPKRLRGLVRKDIIGWFGFVTDDDLRLILDLEKEVPHGYTRVDG